MRQLTGKESRLAIEVLAERTPRWREETTHVNFIKDDPNKPAFSGETNPKEMVRDTYTIEFTAKAGKHSLYWAATREL